MPGQPLDPEDEDMVMHIAIAELLDPDGAFGEFDSVIGARLIYAPKSYLEIRDLKERLFSKLGVYEVHQAIKKARETASIVIPKRIPNS